MIPQKNQPTNQKTPPLSFAEKPMTWNAISNPQAVFSTWEQMLSVTNTLLGRNTTDEWCKQHVWRCSALAAGGHDVWHRAPWGPRVLPREVWLTKETIVPGPWAKLLPAPPPIETGWMQSSASTQKAVRGTRCYFCTLFSPFSEIF